MVTEKSRGKKLLQSPIVEWPNSTQNSKFINLLLCVCKKVRVKDSHDSGSNI